MPGYVPGIHDFFAAMQDVDGRDKPGHDDAAQSARQFVTWLVLP